MQRFVPKRGVIPNLFPLFRLVNRKQLKRPMAGFESGPSDVRGNRLGNCAVTIVQEILFGEICAKNFM